MASSSVLARVGLVSAVAVILGISTLSPLLKPGSDFGKPPAVSGPPLYQTASMPVLPAAEQRAVAPDARTKPARLASTAVARLGFPPQRPGADTSTTALAPPPSQQPAPAAAADVAETPPPAPIVAETESAPKPAKRAAAPKRPKKARTQPPIYTRAVQMSVY